MYLCKCVLQLLGRLVVELADGVMDTPVLMDVIARYPGKSTLVLVAIMNAMVSLSTEQIQSSVDCCCLTCVFEVCNDGFLFQAEIACQWLLPTVSSRCWRSL